MPVCRISAENVLKETEKRDSEQNVKSVKRNAFVYSSSNQKDPRRANRSCMFFRSFVSIQG